MSIEFTEREKKLIKALWFYTSPQGNEWAFHMKYHEDNGKTAKNALLEVGAYRVLITVFGHIIDAGQIESVTDSDVGGAITDMVVRAADGCGVSFYQIEGKTVEEVWEEINRQIKENK